MNPVKDSPNFGNIYVGKIEDEEYDDEEESAWLHHDWSSFGFGYGYDDIYDDEYDEMEAYLDRKLIDFMAEEEMPGEGPFYPKKELPKEAEWAGEGEGKGSECPHSFKQLISGFDVDRKELLASKMIEDLQREFLQGGIPLNSTPPWKYVLMDKDLPHCNKYPPKEKVDGFSQFLTVRPAAMVTESKFLHFLDKVTMEEITKYNCKPPNETRAKEQFKFQEIIQKQCRSREIPRDMSYADKLFRIYSMMEPEEKTYERHKIYTRAFSAFLLHFEAYNPLMRNIKQCYDNVISVRDVQLTNMQKMKRNIETARNEFEVARRTLLFDGQTRLVNLDNICNYLTKKVIFREELIKFVTGLLQLLEFDLTDQVNLRREAEDMKRMILVDINVIRQQLGLDPRPFDKNWYDDIYEFNVKIEEPESMQQFSTNDPLVLKKALQVSRKDYRKAREVCRVIENRYKDVDPRRDFLELKRINEEEGAKEIKIKNEIEELEKEFQEIQKEIEKINVQRKRAAKEARKKKKGKKGKKGKKSKDKKGKENKNKKKGKK